MFSISSAPVMAQSLLTAPGQSSDGPSHPVAACSGAGGCASERSENAQPIGAGSVQVSAGRQVIVDQVAFDAAIQGARVSASDLPPDSNTGGKVTLTLSSLFHRPKLLRVQDGWEVWQYWVRVGLSVHRATCRVKVDQSAFIDTLTITFREAAFQSLPSCSGFVSDADLCVMVGEVLRDVIGIAPSGPVGSRNLYAHSRALVSALDDSIRAGFVAAGGNADTVCVHLTGEGCKLLSRSQWIGLYALAESLGAKITRVDLAHDDFEGVASVDYAVSSFIVGNFSGGGRPPSVSQAGDWLTPGGDPRGRTLYVGTRGSGKVLRVYEKGRQLGDPLSPWVRWELELHSEKRVIPLRVLRCPGEYLSGAYPGGGGTSWISEAQSVIRTIRNSLRISYAAMVHHCRKSYGRLLFAMRGLECSADAVLDRLTDGVFDVPRRLIIPELGGRF